MKLICYLSFIPSFVRGGYGGGGGGAKGAVASPQPRNIVFFFNTKTDRSPLKLGSIMKLTIKIHQKCQKLTFLLPFVLNQVWVFCGHSLKSSRALHAIFISSPSLRMSVSTRLSPFKNTSIPVQPHGF